MPGVGFLIIRLLFKESFIMYIMRTKFLYKIPFGPCQSISHYQTCQTFHEYYQNILNTVMCM